MAVHPWPPPCGTPLTQRQKLLPTVLYLQNTFCPTLTACKAGYKSESPERLKCAAAGTTEHRARVAIPDQSGRVYPLTGRPIKREQCPSPERRSREGRVAQRRAFRQRMRPVRYCYPRPMRTPIGAQQTSSGPMLTPIGAQGQSSLQQRLPTGE